MNTLAADEQAAAHTKMLQEVKRIMEMAKFKAIKPWEQMLVLKYVADIPVDHTGCGSGRTEL